MIEIERKFIAEINNLRLIARAEEVNQMEQGYLVSRPAFEIRLRRMKGMRLRGEAGQPTHWKIALKVGNGLRRYEYEYGIAAPLARVLWSVFDPPRVEKTRISLPDGWEVDIFHGCHSGLILAEREQDANGVIVSVTDPALCLKHEVTDTAFYANKHLATLDCELAKQNVWTIVNGYHGC